MSLFYSPFHSFSLCLFSIMIAFSVEDLGNYFRLVIYYYHYFCLFLIISPLVFYAIRSVWLLFSNVYAFLFRFSLSLILSVLNYLTTLLFVYLNCLPHWDNFIFKYHFISIVSLLPSQIITMFFINVFLWQVRAIFAKLVARLGVCRS